MPHPEFFAAVPSITVYDPLAEFLGAATDGVLEYRYHDAVRLAGHSCPTIAATWTMLRRGLTVLFPERLPERGAIRVEFRESSTTGVTGVMASVATLVTGATVNTGFKGLAGRFDRRHLLAFEQELTPGVELRLSRLDVECAVEVSADLRQVPAAPNMSALMQKCLADEASPDETLEFRRLWQNRVRTILLEYGDSDVVFPVRESCA